MNKNLNILKQNIIKSTYQTLWKTFKAVTRWKYIRKRKEWKKLTEFPAQKPRKGTKINDPKNTHKRES